MADVGQPVPQQSLFRSEDMQYVHLVLAEEGAHATMSELGRFGRMHLVDLGPKDGGVPEVYMHYKKRLQACQMWSRKLAALRAMMAEHGVEPPGADYVPIEDSNPPPDVLGALQNWLEPLEESLNQNIHFKRQQTQRNAEQTERLHVLEKCRDAQLTSASESKSEEKAGGARFASTISGTIPVDRQPYFERMLFRISRGNAIVTFVPIDGKIQDPSSGEEMLKAVFTIVFVGEQLRTRIGKICTFVGATIYAVPTEPAHFDMEVRDIDQRLGEYAQVLIKTKDDIQKLLLSVARDEESKAPAREVGSGRNYETFGDDSRKVSPLVNWEWAVQKEKFICDALRKCDLTGSLKVVRCEGWVPTAALDDLRAALAQAAKRAPEAVLHLFDPPSLPPTYFNLNRITEPFQSIVDTYGTPRYQEANPGLFTIITFPFLFGVMFGDIGHGCFLTLAAAMMIYKEKGLDRMVQNKTMPQMLEMVYAGRYLLFFMGIMATYVGTLYNDCFSIPFVAYARRWTFEEGEEGGFKVPDSTYPYGVDPSWYGTKNELLFFNSLKMKMAVALGVAQMIFGLMLSLLNHLHTEDYLSIAFEFIPQILFMTCTFGYMIILILIKWSIDWSVPRESGPPNLIQTMIGMFLSPGKVDAKDQLYDGQGGVQGFLVAVALLSVPVMLCVKPLIIRSRHLAAHAQAQHGDGISHVPHQLLDDEQKDVVAVGNNNNKDGSGSSSSSSSEAVAIAVGSEEKHDDASEGPVAGPGAAAVRAKQQEQQKQKKKRPPVADHSHGGGGEYSFADHMIGQAIHTIEFVLGAVSNTASYLRLWALSLAHAELAHVFWEKMIIEYGMSTGNGFMMMIGFAVWAAATVVVLMCMDVLECFLHALRLHWVEFQSKFYHADGYKFVPFSFYANIDTDAL